MHFTKTIAAAIALMTTTVSAFPLQKRQDDAVIGNTNSMPFIFFNPFLPFAKTRNIFFFHLATPPLLISFSLLTWSGVGYVYTDTML
jgi:hypothetical protein